MGTDTRRGRGLIVVAAILALALCAAPDAHARDLKRGAKGPRVAFVQKVLGQHVDRIFGKQTKRAVKRFQRRHGLAADGIVGPATWAALKRARGTSSRCRPQQPRQRPRPAARARHHRRRRLRPRHAARRQALPAQQGPDGRRRRRARDLGRARPPRRHQGAQAPPRRDPQRRRRPADHRAPRDRRGEPDRAQALPLRRRPRELQRQRLRLLGLGLLRAARRRAAEPPDGLGRADVLRRRRAPAATSRSTPTPGTRTWSSTAAASTPRAGTSGSRWQWQQRSTSGYTVRHPPGL